MPPWGLAVPCLLLGATLMLNNTPNPLERLSYQDIDGWLADDQEEAIAALRLSCREIVDEGRGFKRFVGYGGNRGHWISMCSRVDDTTSARKFFETNFMPFKVHDPLRQEGLFTGYYEPEIEGSRTPDATFGVPLYRRPPDLVTFDDKQRAATGLSYGRLDNGKPSPYFTRKEIEIGALHGQNLELLWIKDWVDAFFMQVQGSGRVRLRDGTIVRLSYSAKSGLPYTGIGGLLVARGLFAADEMSMQTIRRWMAGNPDAARQLMWENQSFVFFRETKLDDQALGPLGAQHVQLTLGRSLAVDRGHWMFGMPVWLDTAAPSGVTGKLEPIRRLMIAQDTGTAIKGLARGDVFWGTGENASRIAGYMKSPGTMVVLLPVELARDEGWLK